MILSFVKIGFGMRVILGWGVMGINEITLIIVL
jgi:hypothetical protein